MPFGSAVKFAWDTIASEMDGPGRRSRHCLAYHAADKAIVLFGGIDWSSTGGDLFGDTWEFRDCRWSRVKSPNPPPARHRGAMVYHSQGGYAILFGGQTDLAGFLPWNLGDTWLYADHEWKRWGRLFQAHPSARCGHAFAFDENAGVAVLFGGISPIGKPLGDTWVFDGNSWKRVRGPSPSPRRYAAMAYDPELQGCVLNGGCEDDHGRCLFGDSWLFHNLSWQRLDPALARICDDHALAYHQAAKRLVMFGGLAGPHGILLRTGGGWQSTDAQPMPPRHQCSPMVWSDDLNGLVLHGGEAHHAGRQFGTTWLLKYAPC